MTSNQIKDGHWEDPAVCSQKDMSRPSRRGNDPPTTGLEHRCSPPSWGRERVSNTSKYIPFDPMLKNHVSRARIQTPSLDIGGLYGTYQTGKRTQALEELYLRNIHLQQRIVPCHVHLRKMMQTVHPLIPGEHHAPAPCNSPVLRSRGNSCTTSR